MKRFALIAGFAVLAACNQGAKEAPVAEETAAAEPAALDGPQAGTYVTTEADGTETTTVINADGTYSYSAADGTLINKGTVTEEAEGRFCFTPEGADAKPACLTLSAPAADGSFTATPDGGKPQNVRTVPAEPAGTPEPAPAN